MCEDFLSKFSKKKKYIYVNVNLLNWNFFEIIKEKKIIRCLVRITSTHFFVGYLYISIFDELKENRRRIELEQKKLRFFDGR